MSRPLWFVRFIEITFPFRYLLAKLTKVPILGHLIHFLFFGRDRMFYLPRKQVVPMNSSISMPEEHAVPLQVVHHFIQQARFHWIMDVCICRNATGCEDYPIDLGCLFLGEAVLNINPKLGRLVTKEEAMTHTVRCQEAGLVHLIGRNKLDTFWLGVGPGHRLLTICHCCPCCCLWKMLPHLDGSIGRKVTKLPGVEVRVTDRCNGCGECTDGVCFVKAIHLNGKQAVINGECRGCGRCVDACPESAIELRFHDFDVIERTVRQIQSLVDVT